MRYFSDYQRSSKSTGNISAEVATFLRLPLGTPPTHRITEEEVDEVLATPKNPTITGAVSITHAMIKRLPPEASTALAAI